MILQSTHILFCFSTLIAFCFTIFCTQEVILKKRKEKMSMPYRLFIFHHHHHHNNKEPTRCVLPWRARLSSSSSDLCTSSAQRLVGQSSCLWTLPSRPPDQRDEDRSNDWGSVHPGRPNAGLKRPSLSVCVCVCDEDNRDRRGGGSDGAGAVHT